MLIDTHAHLNFEAFKKDFFRVIKKSLKNNIFLVNVGTNYETSKKAIEITKMFREGVWASVGLHPIHLEKENFDYRKFKELIVLAEKKVIAVGECGLDYLKLPQDLKKKKTIKEKQKKLLLKQIELAQEFKLPVIFHCRMAQDDLLGILKEKTKKEKIKGVAHCFVGDLEQLKLWLEMGFYIGFNGIIFKKIEGIDFERIIKKTPLERTLVETDSPYLNPLNPSERNEPVYLKYIIEKIAKIKNLSFEKIAKITTKNAKDLFKIL